MSSTNLFKKEVLQILMGAFLALDIVDLNSQHILNIPSVFCVKTCFCLLKGFTDYFLFL